MMLICTVRAIVMDMNFTYKSIVETYALYGYLALHTYSEVYAQDETDNQVKEYIRTQDD